MSINSTTELPGALRSRLAVPWSTVVPLAIVMAYADGFWMVSLRSAVGAIERTQAPFANWLLESTLTLPIFVFAVLGAMTLALRWFGPVLRASRKILAALLIVAAGTVVGIAAIAVSSAYDYGLQSSQLQLMESMSHTCTAGGCLALQQQASLGLQVRAVGYASGILLVTNVVLVGWVVAFRGGRLDVTRAPRAARALLPQPAFAADGALSRVEDWRRFLAAVLFGSAVIHAAVVPGQVAEWAGAGLVFGVLAAMELAVAAVALASPQPGALLAAAIVSIGSLALWLYSHTVGVSFGSGIGALEQVGLTGGAAFALEASTLLVAVILLRGRGQLRQPPASAHVRWLALVAVIAVTAIGLAGSGLASLDDFGSSGDQSVLVPHH
jgi:hypothetical protein